MPSCSSRGVCVWGGEGFTLTQKAPLLAIQARPLPDGAPGPLGDELLSRPREGGCVPHGIVDVLVAEDSPANLQPLFEELAVQLGESWVCGGHYRQNVKEMWCEPRTRYHELRVAITLVSG